MSRVPSVGRAVTQKKPQNDSGPAARDLSSRRSANPKHDKLAAPVILKPPTEEPEEEQEDEEGASDGSDGEGVEKVPSEAESVPPMAPQEEDEPMMEPYPDYKSMSDSQRDEYLEANKKYRESLNKKGQTTKPAQPRPVPGAGRLRGGEPSCSVRHGPDAAGELGAGVCACARMGPGPRHSDAEVVAQQYGHPQLAHCVWG